MASPFDQAGPGNLGSAGSLVPSVGGAAGSIANIAEDPLGLGLSSGPPSAGGSFSPAQILRYKWSILVVSILVAVPAIIAIWSLVVPDYRAVAEVRVRPIIPRLVFKTENNGLIPLYQSYLNTQVLVIRSPTVLQRVLDRPDVQETAWYSEPPKLLGNPLSPMDRLRKVLIAAPRLRTEVIEVGMTARSATDAAAIVNAVLDEYVKYDRESTEQTDDMLYRQLTDEVNRLRGQIEGREGLVSKYRRDLGTASPDELVTQKRMRLDEAEAKLKELRRQIATAEWQRKSLEELLGKNGSAGATSQPSGERPAVKFRFEDDTDWRRLTVDLKNAKYELEVRGGKLGKSHPKLKELEKRVALAEELVAERERQLKTRVPMASPTVSATPRTGGHAMPFDLDSLNLRIGQLKHEATLLKQDIEAEQGSFARTFDAAEMLAKENEVIQHTQTLYGAVRTRLAEKTMERNVPGSIGIQARAFPPSEPDGDRRIILSVLAMFGGLAAGVSIAFLRLVLGQSIHEIHDLKQAVSAPFLGQLPLLANIQTSGDQELSLQGEYMRMIRTALLQRTDGRGGNAILVTSAVAGSGKTTISTLLARSLADCGKRVLLVDADLRNPSVMDRLGLHAERGLVDTLSGRTTDADTIIPSGTDRLSILPAGGDILGDDSPEILADGAFTSCLARWRDEYDIVLFDSSPVLPVADARILSRHVDGTVLVVKEGHCRRSDVVDALTHLVTSGGRLLGTVFIGSLPRDRARSSYYTYPYGGPTRSTSS